MRVLNWRDAIRQSNLHSTTKLVLYNLSLYMSDAGAGCFPSINTQCSDTGLSKMSVIKHLKISENESFIAISKHGYAGQKWKRNEYVACFPSECVLGEYDKKKVVNDIDHLNQESSKGGKPNSDKVVNEVYSNSPFNSPFIIIVSNKIMEFKSFCNMNIKPDAMMYCIVEWEKQGFDIDLDVLPALEAMEQQIKKETRPVTIQSVRYFEPAILKLHDQRNNPQPMKKQKGQYHDKRNNGSEKTHLGYWGELKNAMHKTDRKA